MIFLLQDDAGSVLYGKHMLHNKKQPGKHHSEIGERMDIIDLV